MRSCAVVLTICVLLIGSCACTAIPQTTVTATADPSLLLQSTAIPAPGNETGCLHGLLPATAERWPDVELNVYAASFTGNEQDQGFYVFDSNSSLHSPVDGDGEFTLCGLQPGKYVLIAGPTVEEGVTLVNEDQDLLILDVTAGVTTEVEQSFLP